LRVLVEQQINAPRYHGSKLENIRAIAFSGEASTTEIEEIRHVFWEALPKLQDRIRCFVGPVWVVAIGAAELARHIILTPPFFEKVPVDLSNGELTFQLCTS
jgi:hypothetical protein